MNKVSNTMVKFYQCTSATMGRRLLTGLIISLLAAGSLALAGHLQEGNWNPLDYIKEHNWALLGATAGLGFIGTYILLPKSVIMPTPSSTDEFGVEITEDNEDDPTPLQKGYDFFSSSFARRLLFSIVIIGITAFILYQKVDHNLLKIAEEHSWQVVLGAGAILSFLIFGARVLPEVINEKKPLLDRITWDSQGGAQ